MNVSVIRKLVQLAAFVFLVYGSVVVGFYSADKLSGAFPVLACAYDAQTADYCALIPFQHQMDHRFGAAIAAGTSLLAALLPTLITLGTFLVLFVILNKAFCGWICPLGFFQEVMGMLGQKLGIARAASLPDTTVRRLRPVKWLALALLVFGIPVLAGVGMVDHSLGSPYCSICPSRILTTLASGNGSQLVMDTSSAGALVLSLTGALLFGLMTSLSLKMRQPFCRVCPMLAMHAMFRKFGLVRLVKQAKPRCEKCGLCAKACPMDIHEIHTEMNRKDVTFEDCTLCGRCVEFCPDKDVLQLKYAFVPVLRADPAYFKARKKAQSRWESSNLVSWWRARKEKR